MTVPVGVVASPWAVVHSRRSLRHLPQEKRNFGDKTLLGPFVQVAMFVELIPHSEAGVAVAAAAHSYPSAHH